MIVLLTCKDVTIRGLVTVREIVEVTHGHQPTTARRGPRSGHKGNNHLNGDFLASATRGSLGGCYPCDLILVSARLPAVTGGQVAVLTRLSVPFISTLKVLAMINRLRGCDLSCDHVNKPVTLQSVRTYEVYRGGRLDGQKRPIAAGGHPARNKTSMGRTIRQAHVRREWFENGIYSRVEDQKRYRDDRVVETWRVYEWRYPDEFPPDWPPIVRARRGTVGRGGSKAKRTS